MKKQEFLKALRKKLRGLPKEEREERVAFYSEMIDDRIEEGLSEEEAVAAMDEKAAQETDFSTEGAEKAPKKKTKLSPLAITLLIIGSPIWLSLIISLAAVAISVFASFFAVFISLWATVLGLAAGAIGGVFVSLVLLFTENAFWGVILLSFSLISAGLAIFCFFGCRALTGYIVPLTKKAYAYLTKSFK